MGQVGDGNDVSQSEVDSQETGQSSQCVSGDSNFFSCNNGSSNSVGTNEQGTQGIGLPVIISNDNIYVRDGNPDTATGPDMARSTIACDAGDALISGTSNYELSDGSALKQINHFLRILGFSWNVQGALRITERSLLLQRFYAITIPPNSFIFFSKKKFSRFLHINGI